MTRAQKKRAKLVAGAVAGPVLLLIGIILHAVTASQAATCNSTLGQIAQGLGYQQQNCATANMVSSIGVWLIWGGVLIAIGGAGGLFFLAREKQAAEAKAAAAKRPGSRGA